MSEKKKSAAEAVTTITVKPATKAKAEPKAKTAPKPKAEPKAKATPKPKAEPKAKAAPKPKAEPKAKTAPEPKAALKAKAEPKAKTAPKAKKIPAAVGRDLADVVIAAAAEHQPIDPVMLDLSGLSSVADYFFVASAASPRQMEAIAEKIVRRAREHGVRPLGREGGSKGGGANDRWMLVDLGDVVVHIFNLEAREMYDLEGLWTDAPRRPVKK